MNTIERMTEAHLKAIGNTFKRAQISAYKELLREIVEHDYTTIAEVKGAIYSNIDIIEGLDDE